jgi:hypothetical protein
MSDTEILTLLAHCKGKSNLSWDVLVNQFSKQLVALSGRLTEDELYALLDTALLCYQKGYEEFAAGQEAVSFINEIRTRARQHGQ